MFEENSGSFFFPPEIRWFHCKNCQLVFAATSLGAVLNLHMNYSIFISMKNGGKYLDEKMKNPLNNSRAHFLLARHFFPP